MAADVGSLTRYGKWCLLVAVILQCNEGCRAEEADIREMKLLEEALWECLVDVRPPQDRMWKATYVEAALDRERDCSRVMQALVAHVRRAEGRAELLQSIEAGIADIFARTDLVWSEISRSRLPDGKEHRLTAQVYRIFTWRERHRLEWCWLLPKEQWTEWWRRDTLPPFEPCEARVWGQDIVAPDGSGRRVEYEFSVDGRSLAVTDQLMKWSPVWIEAMNVPELVRFHIALEVVPLERLARLTGARSEQGSAFLPAEVMPEKARLREVLRRGYHAGRWKVRERGDRTAVIERVDPGGRTQFSLCFDSTNPRRWYAVWVEDPKTGEVLTARLWVYDRDERWKWFVDARPGLLWQKKRVAVRRFLEVELSAAPDASLFSPRLSDFASATTFLQGERRYYHRGKEVQPQRAAAMGGTADAQQHRSVWSRRIVLSMLIAGAAVAAYWTMLRVKEGR